MHLSRGFSLGQQLANFADQWTKNDLKVAGYKSITIFFFLSEIIFREKMVSLSNNDTFNNDKIFLYNIWHFSEIARIDGVSIFVVFVSVFVILCQNVIFGDLFSIGSFWDYQAKIILYLNCCLQRKDWKFHFFFQI